MLLFKQKTSTVNISDMALFTKMSLDGVACTTKTTILKRIMEDLADSDRIRVHLSDYKEASDILQMNPREPVLNGMSYIIYRLNMGEQYDSTKIHLCDRQPASAMIYYMIFNNYDDEKVIEYFTWMKRNRLTEVWKSIILLPKAGQEKLVKNMMVKRANGVDVCTEKYVSDQRRVFELWAKIMNYPVVEIDFEQPLESQQRNIIDQVYKMIF
ncbi:nicotinamide riboside kinase 1 [Malacosoma neustria nucleopolyhedrovirus]|uniref:nicotinamide riboside kinase 1 n=1 Tax=Malacosoma neustria nuclear polyhedrosis virus TaxID=38012 RepID=UPI000E35EB5D|nr:nicotinamide riboside kinase 1 [Malacosoma neustria nucleopolyhedrovirus]AUF81621.1 nicotinamide riboside kinase 1 [Malacosoma neustria nucleopolyhedrovirus]